MLGLLHDLGHIPYGHAGESVADSMIGDYEFTPEEVENIIKIRKLIFGEEYVNKLNTPRKNSKYPKNICFEHNENSVLRYITLCKEYGYEVDNDIIVGILAHSTSRYKTLPKGLDQQAVRLADKLAYINYDVSDLFISFEGKEEFAALVEIYEKPLLDPNGNEIKITLPDGKSYTLLEFLTQVSVEDRINLFTNESIREAKAHALNPGTEYAGKGYETILTGANDTGVKLAGVRKKLDKKDLSPEERAELEVERKRLEMDLYTRSPILYAAYEIKNRSDEFIRTGKGLTTNLQVDRTTRALSSVGNPDLLNEYIYKSLATELQAISKYAKGLSIDEVRKKYEGKIPIEFIDFYADYLEFREKENNLISSLPGNEEGLVYPEIYTILNYIGIHSNTQLNQLANAIHYQERFSEEILPQIEELLSDEECYDSEKGTLTKKGREIRDSLVSKYGAKIKLDYGLEEENIGVTSKDGTSKNLQEAGYDVESLTDSPKEVTIEMFGEAKSKAEQEYIRNATQTIYMQNHPELESPGKRM